MFHLMMHLTHIYFRLGDIERVVKDKRGERQPVAATTGAALSN